jgi:hypothetical protein
MAGLRGGNPALTEQQVGGLRNVVVPPSALPGPAYLVVRAA